MHGIASTAERKRRPEGGTLVCEYCDALPFRTYGGRALHYRFRHGVHTSNVASIQRRQRRNLAHALLVGDAEPVRASEPLVPPSIAGVVAHTAGRTTRTVHDDLRVAMFLSASLERWSREIRAAELDVADALAAILANNFGPAPRVLPTSYPISKAQYEHLRRRLLFMVNWDWARTLDLAPVSLAAALTARLPAPPQNPSR